MYIGCGAFDRYAIIGDASTLALLQYPEPGKTLSVDCLAVNSCTAIRVLDTT